MNYFKYLVAKLGEVVSKYEGGFRVIIFKGVYF